MATAPADWRERWCLLDVVQVGARLAWYRFQYRDGSQRCIVADCHSNTIAEVCQLLDDAEARRLAKGLPLCDGHPTYLRMLW